MLLLVSGASVSFRDYRATYPRGLGRLITPHDGIATSTLDGPWAADNAAFSRWDPDAFVSMIARLRGVPGCLFVAAPDVIRIVRGNPIGDAVATRARYDEWRPLLEGWPRAYVAQDGQRFRDVPWDDISALFIGGSTAYKEGPAARTLVSYGKAFGKWVHMGRVNTRRRWRYAHAIGCDSVDGSGFSRWPEEMFARWSRWSIEREQQPGFL